MKAYKLFGLSARIFGKAKRSARVVRSIAPLHVITGVFIQLSFTRVTRMGLPLFLLLLLVYLYL